MPSCHSFTLCAPGILRVIKSSAFVSPAFDPTTLAAHLHPRTLQFDAIWDTGATSTVISQKVAAACGLKPIGLVRAQTAGGVANCEVFLINLTLPNKVCFANISVTQADLGEHTNLLIGMDIITKGDFVITNKEGQTCFSFRVPSLERIEFSEHP